MNTRGSNMEIWKDIKGYEGLYQVSNLGNVKACEKEWSSHHSAKLKHKAQLLKADDNHGYKRVSLHKNKKYKHFAVHRLVAETFILNPENKPYINHKNFIRSDNRVENLEWVNHKENSIYSRENAKNSALKRWKPKSKEHYIYFAKNRYRVMIYYLGKCVVCKSFISIKEAKIYRDEKLKELKNRRIK